MENLTFSYPKRNPVLRGVSFNVHAGEIIGITGLSGSGKTTLLHCIAGVIPHVEKGKLRGEVRVGGESIAGVSLAQISQKTGIVFQDPDNRMAATVVEDEIAFVLENMCLPPEDIRARVDEILKLFGMETLRLRAPQSLSGGEKQLLAIASVFAADPPVIVMDEPVSHLDAEGREKIRSLIRKMKSMGRTVLMAEHDFFHLDMADRILFLEDGVIAREGPPEEMIPFLEEHLTEDSDGNGRREERHGTVFFRENDGSCRPQIQAAGSGKDAIIVRDLTFSYRGKTPVFQGFSAEFRLGTITALTGRNGCGKSTLVKNMTGLLRPSGGRILVGGQNIAEMSIAQIAEHIGFVMQNPYCQILGITVREEMETGLKNRKIPAKEREQRISFYLDYFDLEMYADIFPGHLSIGEKQRLEMAAVMALGADYLILDEPTAALDMKRRKRLGRLLCRLRDSGKGILLISHDERFHEKYADRVIRMDSAQTGSGADCTGREV